VALEPEATAAQLLSTIPPWSEQHAMRPFFEAVRDRLVIFFEKLTHKPKLVGVAGCSPNAGTSTVAAGLAASLSQTGDGSVLLVDLNTPEGAAHPFFNGKPAASILDGLESGKRQSALVQENLYVVSATDSSNLRILPKRLTNLLPRFKASDYDYIIFDLPMVTSTSVTPRLAGMMDLMLLVVDSERVHPEVGQRAVALLTMSGARVAAVLNRVHNYVPKWLKPEF
jgi:Mrp family chromosome partitioning ATPase